VSRDGLGRLYDAVGTRAVREAERLGPPDDEGRETLRISMEWPDEAVGRFVAAAPDVEVLQPARLREDLLVAAWAAIDAYSRP
jgi:predicted DNA-binding transcriptional regulator YafY